MLPAGMKKLGASLFESQQLLPTNPPLTTLMRGENAEFAWKEELFSRRVYDPGLIRFSESKVQVILPWKMEECKVWKG